MRRLLASMFITSFAMGIVGLVLVLYAKDHLNASYTEIGLLGPAYAALHVLLSVPAGRLADRYGRGPLLTLGLLSTACTFLLYSRANTVAWLLAVRLLHGAAEAPIWVNAQSAVVEFSTPMNRGRAMGAYGVSWATGFTLGPPIGGLLYGAVGPIRSFLIGATLTLLAAAVTAGAHFHKPKVTPEKMALRGLLPACLIGMFYFGIVAIVFTLFPAYARQLDISEAQIGLLLALFGGIRIVFLVPMGGLSDRFGSRSIILLGMLGLAASLASIAATTEYLMFAAAVLLLGVSEGATYPAVMSMVSKVGGDENRGYVLGVFNAVATVGWGLLPGVGGLTADVLGPTAPYLMCALIALTMFAFVWRSSL